jgi:hypothetical protein
VNEAERRGVSPRAYAAVIAGVFVVAAVLVGQWLLRDSTRLVGTNSVAPDSNVFIVKKGQTMCVRDLYVPARADAVRLLLIPPANTRPVIDVALKTSAGYSARASRVVSVAGYNDFTIPRAASGAPGILCAQARGDVTVSGYAGLQANGRPEAFVDHKPQTSRVSVWFIDTHKRSLLSLLPTAAHRASVFRAGFVGAWTYLVLLLLLPLLWWAGLRSLVRRRA